MRKAFTFLELVFVIVVLGILSIGGSDMYLRIYNTYFESRTYNDMQAKTQLALDQIANRLTYRIKSSVIVSPDIVGGNPFTSLESAGVIPPGTTYRLEWISADNDSLRGIANPADTYTPPGWSGFIDLDSNSTNRNILFTPGGNLTAVRDIIFSLSDSDIDLNLNPSAAGNAVIIFPDAAGTPAQYGWWGGADSSLVHPIFRNDDSTLLPIGGVAFAGTDKEVFEQYQLAFSAYALEYNPTTKNITLYYNYQPWFGEDITTADSTIFVEDVSNFIFKSVGSMLKIQLCINRADHQVSATNEEFSVCKERAIF